jgi:hypothetical protein
MLAVDMRKIREVSGQLAGVAQLSDPKDGWEGRVVLA